MDWKTFAGFVVKEGAGLAVGEAFLALAGPIGWGITATSTGVSLISLTNKNKKIANEAVKEAKEIVKAREALDEANEKTKGLKSKTELLYNDMNKQRNRITGFMNMNYNSISTEDKSFLGTLINNTRSMSVLLNETIA